MSSELCHGESCQQREKIRPNDIKDLVIEANQPESNQQTACQQSYKADVMVQTS